MATIRTDSNAQAVAAALHAMARDVEDLDRPNDQAGRVVLTAARPPRREGTLAAGMFARTQGREVVMASHARHFTFVHWGAPRAHVRAQPFLLSALRASRSEVVDVYLEHLRETARTNA